MNEKRRDFAQGTEEVFLLVKVHEAAVVVSAIDKVYEEVLVSVVVSVGAEPETILVARKVVVVDFISLEHQHDLLRVVIRISRTVGQGSRKVVVKVVPSMPIVMVNFVVYVMRCLVNEISLVFIVDAYLQLNVLSIPMDVVHEKRGLLIIVEVEEMIVGSSSVG